MRIEFIARNGGGGPLAPTAAGWVVVPERIVVLN